MGLGVSVNLGPHLACTHPTLTFLSCFSLLMCVSGVLGFDTAGMDFGIFFPPGFCYKHPAPSLALSFLPFLLFLLSSVALDH